MTPTKIITAYFLAVVALVVADCNNIRQHTPAVTDQLLKDTVQSTPQTTVNENPDTVTYSAVVVGRKIQGDFDGDGALEWATVVKNKEGQGNPVENGTPDEYTITFSNNKCPPLVIGCCNALLINEGDLMGDKKDKLSIFQAPMNGNVYMMYTYAFVNGA